MLQISKKVFNWTSYVYLIVIHVVMFLPGKISCFNNVIMWRIE